MPQRIGSAQLEKQPDGTITVAHADRVIAVTRELWDALEPPHKRDDGTIWLDTFGTYRYQPVSVDAHANDIRYDHLIFQRVEASCFACGGAMPDCHICGSRAISPERQAAYDAVFAVIALHPPVAQDSYWSAVENGRIWSAVKAALYAVETPLRARIAELEQGR